MRHHWVVPTKILPSVSQALMAVEHSPSTDLQNNQTTLIHALDS